MGRRRSDETAVFPSGTLRALGFFAFIGLTRGANAQDARNARILHRDGSATLSVDDPFNRCLFSGLIALREEYAWRVNLEEPPYERRPRGEKFESTYSEHAQKVNCTRNVFGAL